jgi:hypothetical protein
MYVSPFGYADVVAEILPKCNESNKEESDRKRDGCSICS